MKSLIHNAIALLGHAFGSFHLFEVNRAPRVMVSGYSYSSGPEQQDREEENLERYRAGIFYADIANYSRLTEQDEEGTHQRMVESMKIIEEKIAANHGRVAHLAGDAILAEFVDADSALRCAIDVQLAARRWNANLPMCSQILFRIGVNFGDVITEQGDIYGRAVNLAARLEKLAHSGGICVSESVRKALEDNPAYDFVALGRQYVKNISEPVQAFWIEVESGQAEGIDHTCAVKYSAVKS